MRAQHKFTEHAFHPASADTSCRAYGRFGDIDSKTCVEECPEGFYGDEFSGLCLTKDECFYGSALEDESALHEPRAIFGQTEVKYPKTGIENGYFNAFLPGFTYVNSDGEDRIKLPHGRYVQGKRCVRATNEYWDADGVKHTYSASFTLPSIPWNTNTCKSQNK